MTTRFSSFSTLMNAGLSEPRDERTVPSRLHAPPSIWPFLAKPLVLKGLLPGMHPDASQCFFTARSDGMTGIASAKGKTCWGFKFSSGYQ
jgi:hypothetical protein